MEDSPRAGATLTDRQFNERRKLGRQIMEEYVAQRRLRAPKYRVNTATFPPEFWDGIAKFVAERQLLPPEAWVGFVFDRAGARYALPQELKSPALASRFQVAVSSQSVISEVETRLLRCAVVVERELKFGRPLDEILFDPHLLLNPAFAYCVAVSANRPDLSGVLAGPAAAFLRQFPHYRQTTLAPYLQQVPEASSTD